MRVPLEYVDKINTCYKNQQGLLAKHMLSFEVLQHEGWDIAFPENNISHIDAIVFNDSYTYKFQIKHVTPILRESGSSRKYMIPLRNHIKYKFRKDQTLASKSKAYKYFEHGIDCVYAFDSQPPSIHYGGMFVWKTRPHRDGLTVYSVAIEEPMHKHMARVWMTDLMGFDFTHKQHLAKNKKELTKHMSTAVSRGYY